MSLAEQGLSGLFFPVSVIRDSGELEFRADVSGYIRLSELEKIPDAVLMTVTGTLVQGVADLSRCSISPSSYILSSDSVYLSRENCDARVLLHPQSRGYSMSGRGLASSASVLMESFFRSLGDRISAAGKEYGEKVQKLIGESYFGFELAVCAALKLVPDSGGTNDEMPAALPLLLDLSSDVI